MIADEYVFDEHPKPQEIEDFLEGHPQNNLLQHARWSQVKENWSMKSSRCPPGRNDPGVCDDFDPSAAAGIKSVLYSPRTDRQLSG